VLTPGLDPRAAVAVADGRTFAPHGRRWLRWDPLIGLTFLAACLAYTDRVNISVAALAMQQQFSWSQTQKGFVLSSFFIGYMLCLLLSGWLATRFGGKRLLGLAVIVWSVCTLLTPAAAAVSLPALVTARIAMGVGESAVFPSAFEIIGRWVPPNARSRATGRILSGIPIGQVTGLILTGWMLAHFAWAVAFYSFGAVGLVWAIVWFRFMARSPTKNADESPMEREPMLADARPVQSGEPLPWRKLLLSMPVLAIVCGHFASNWTLYVLLNGCRVIFAKCYISASRRPVCSRLVRG
jgi:ACS family sodium-dependent inorganic phosphate cotransporter